MKITDRFVGDHKTFRKLIGDLDRMPARLENETDQRRVVRLVELFVDHLMLHAWGEEIFFYPKLAEAGDAFEPQAARRLTHEHGDIDEGARQVEGEARKPAGGEWRAHYDRFKADLVAHMTEEEQKLFPTCERILGAPALEAMSSELERRRREAPPVRRHQPF